MNAKFYLLLLNDSYDLNEQCYLGDKHTLIRDVLEYRSTTITWSEELKEKFADLADTVKAKKNNVITKGFFPVIGIEQEGKMFDLVTGKIIKSPKEFDNKGLSYISKKEISHDYACHYLKMLDEKAESRYTENLTKLEEQNKSEKGQYSIIRPNRYINIDGNYSMLFTVDNTFLPIYLEDMGNRLPDYNDYNEELNLYRANKLSKKQLRRTFDKIRYESQEFAYNKRKELLEKETDFTKIKKRERLNVIEKQ